ncbi:TRADD-N-associated membrane domain-containing protein [Streptomyces sp. Sge12]|uniref:TRADD-N-associated membrane domain-containing protein n=1 Tax=Streptomyces sp. Sge12 TaxID=1972846 RepID=UPI0013318EC4|nr:hypothetical protein [Streptomyces sp. Sge12]
MDPALIAAAASAVKSAAGSDAWTAAIARLRARTEAETGAPAAGAVEVPSVGTEVPAQAALSQLLETYYTKVGRRADVSFFAAIAAAVLGYVIIAAGILVGIYRSDDLVLAVVTTAAGALSQVLSFFFFRNRAEERKMMIQVLADLREDAEQNARAVRALDLVEQIQQPLLRDNLTAAVALELSGAAADLKSIHASLKLFETNGDHTQFNSA